MKLVLTATILISFSSLYAQNTSISTDRKSYILNTLAYSNDREQKEQALEILKKLAEDGELNDVAFIRIVVKMGWQGSIIKVRDRDYNIVNDYPFIRIMACNILGIIGGPESEAALIEVIAGDKEPAVVAVALEELAKITATNASSSLISKINTYFLRLHYTTRDNTLAQSYTATIKKLVANNAKLLNVETINIIYAIASSESLYIKEVRAGAFQLLLSWL